MAKVLLIDDEVTMVQMVTELLRREGHEVFPFSSYNAAVETLEAQRPELVITDLYLDKTRTHGLEILQKARALNPPVHRHRHHRLRHHRNGGGCDEKGRVRLFGKALQSR